ncbi:MAG: transglycosylase domain-containing protein [Hyphomicrobium sp.]
MGGWRSKQAQLLKRYRLQRLEGKIEYSFTELWNLFNDACSSASTFFSRFQLQGWKRLLNELLSDGFTLSAGFLVGMYALAIPALLEFDEARFLTGQYSVKFLDKYGKEIGQRGILHNDAVPLDQIPDSIIKATLATEDRRFFEHYGIDLFGTIRALSENLRANEVIQGGSSLTQQLAKNLFLSSERSLDRKVKELFLSFLLESRFTKSEILKLYLDRAYMGGGAFGVEAASQFYFGKSIREINLAEAALLAGLYKAPTKYAPHINLPASRARTNEVLQNLVEAGFYSPAEVQEARQNPARIIETTVEDAPDWFLDYAFEEVQRLTKDKGPYVLTARTTVDLSIQKAANDALIPFIQQQGKAYQLNSGALVAMETDGAVRALVGGPDYGENQFNRATHARRQPGSSFKVYVYATALEKGYKPETTVRDASRSCGRWSPSNFGGGGGSGASLPLWLALAKSLNTVATELSFSVGREKVIEMTQRLGIKGIRKTCSMALGDYGISPLEHTGGIATFANGGKKATPYAILDLYTSKGELIYSREKDEPPSPQVIKSEVAQNMNQMLNKVVTEGTGQRAALDFTHVAGKTGTSTGPNDVWFVGFTGKYVASIWLGNDDNKPMKDSNTGGQVVAPLWHDFMVVIHKNMNIPTIPGLQPHPKQIEEYKRIEELKVSNPELAATLIGEADPNSHKMPEKTRSILRTLATDLRNAASDKKKNEEKKEGNLQSSPSAFVKNLVPKSFISDQSSQQVLSGASVPSKTEGIESAQ